MIKTVRCGWPHLSILERIILVTLFPLFFLTWCSIWIICGTPELARRRPRGD